MRLDRLVSQATGHSRREARRLIRQGRVEVDGVVEWRPEAALTADHAVSLDGEPLGAPKPCYLMLHKPVGVITATRDARQATVVELLPGNLARRVHPVGRLDKDTSGLLLLSDDGQWSHQVSAPRHGCAKVYRARLVAPLGPDAEALLAAGLRLRNDPRPALPAFLERLDGGEVRITVTEGRYHLVRRLVAALGSRVAALHRERIGGLKLDSALAPGEWRTLSEAERHAVLGT
jgi:16S rRNA pseudouridine516 synthase